MKRLGLAAAVMLAGLALLLAMVVRLVEPNLGLSLIGYATICAGMMLGLAGALQSEGRRRQAGRFANTSALLRSRRRSPRSTATPGGRR